MVTIALALIFILAGVCVHLFYFAISWTGLTKVDKIVQQLTDEPLLDIICLNCARNVK